MSDNEETSSFNLTSFLFGNIDETGQLEDDILDNECKKHLHSLSKLGFGTFIDEIITEEVKDKSDNEKPTDSEEQAENPICNDGELLKSPSAKDYFDINELADDLHEELDIKKEKEDCDYDADDEENLGNAKDLMPPPPAPRIIKDSADKPKKLNTPLASMLPPKYAGVPVTEIFPEFRVDKTLRFSRLFGSGKHASLPHIWRSVKKRRKKRKSSSQQQGSGSGSDSDPGPETKRGWNFNFGPHPTPDQIISDDEDKFLRPIEPKQTTTKSVKEEAGETGPKVADWRFGPAAYWYDLQNVPETGDGFTYGFKLREKINEENNLKSDYPDEAFLMVSQLHWEDDVVWNGDDIKHTVLQKLNSKANAAGWVPSSANRTAGAFSQPGKGLPPGVRAPAPIQQPSSVRQLTPAAAAVKTPSKGDGSDDTWYSIFPVENEELVYGCWEADVVWDDQSMDHIPKPKILTLDPNDENIVLGIPNDVDPAKQRLEQATAPPPKVKIPHPHVKKSKILLSKAGVINVLEEDSPPPTPKSPDTDPFNVSNDSYYAAKSTDSALRLKVSGGIQHSTPVVELRVPFVQTYMGQVRLKNFHRPLLKRYSHGGLYYPGPHPVHSLAKHIRKKAKVREAEREASGGGDVFFMRTPEDLSGRDGELILVEFCEEHPPLINQVGMCSKIKNYYKRRAGKDNGPQEYRYGEVAYAHTSPFLGVMAPGKTIQTVENNMYRAPIYEHTIPGTDFIVIRTRHQYFIREADSLFVAGQLCPLYEVPGPNSKRANNFVRDFLQVFIYRLFWKSTDVPKKIKMEDIRRAFPTHSESSIRKRLKLCADFKRTGMDSNFWVIKPDFRLPTEEEIRAMVSPEQCCAFFSMIAAEQRLKDAGYGEKFMLTAADDDEDDLQLKIDDEVKVAPWNTTRAYIHAMKGKCLLQLIGPADPTGCGEGFSYVRVPNKPVQTKEEQESQPKIIVSGTDADLRKLSLNNAKAILRKYCVPEEEIKKLSRWEVIDVVRTLSTEKAKAGEEAMNKFSRGNRFSIAEHQERYKEECQRIFDLQNRVLSSYEVLSTDEGESSEEDSSDIEEMGKNIENMLSNKKTSTQLSLEKEEQERQELKKLIYEQDPKKKDTKKKDDDDNPAPSSVVGLPGRVLKIYRTYRDSEGKEYTRTEMVRKPAVIDMYVKIRTSKDENFIRNYSTMDEHLKEEMKREKKRLQEQLRKIKKNQEKEKMQALSRQQSSYPGLMGVTVKRELSESPPLSTSSHPRPAPTTPPTPRSRKKPSKLKPDLKLKCGACGQVGHMRTNKSCPMYSGPDKPMSAPSVTLTEEQEEEFEKQLNTDDEDLVNVDGTKVKLSSKLIKHADEMRRRSLMMKVHRDVLARHKKRKSNEHCDYLKRHQRPANRRRTDPLVVLSTMLEAILNEMRDLPDVQPFLFPVNAKAVPDYYKIVQKPMDLQTIRENLRLKKYQSREEFLADVNQIVENSTLYNGGKSVLTVAARRMLEVCVDRLREKEERLMRLEKAINPLLDDDDQVALTFILDNVVNNKLKTLSESWPFAKPVNKKSVKDYYTIIKEPMDLETIEKKVHTHKYHSRKEFLDDIEKILTNCVTYNGKDSPYTQKAELLVRVARQTLEEYDEHLTQLEKSISIVQERALEQAEDSLGQWDDQDSTQPDVSGYADFEFLTPDQIKQEQESGVLDDLQFSSEEELEEVSGYQSADDDSQQVAEAMVQLGNFAYYTQPPIDPTHEETMEVDPNYDPCEFLGGLKREKEAMAAAAMAGMVETQGPHATAVQDDLAMSDSDDERDRGTDGLAKLQPVKLDDEIEDGGLWF